MVALAAEGTVETVFDKPVKTAMMAQLTAMPSQTDADSIVPDIFVVMGSLTLMRSVIPQVKQTQDAQINAVSHSAVMESFKPSSEKSAMLVSTTLIPPSTGALLCVL